MITMAKEVQAANHVVAASLLVGICFVEELKTLAFLNLLCLFLKQATLQVIQTFLSFSFFFSHPSISWKKLARKSLFYRLFPQLACLFHP